MFKQSLLTMSERRVASTILLRVLGGKYKIVVLCRDIKTRKKSNTACMLDGLAFLPMTDVEEGITFMKNTTLEGLEKLVDYLDLVFVSGSIRRVQPSPNVLSVRSCI